MNYDDLGNKLSIIEKEIFNPTSDLYLDNLLDLATSITYDIHCSGTWKNSKPIKTFLDRFSNFSDQIYKLRVSLNDFHIIKTVGQGGFGRVDLVKHKQTKNIYAMKVMDKSTFVQNSFNGFWEERDIMARNTSDWLIKCFYTFMDLKKLYIVMEYMPGGDLYHWMMELEDFSDEQTHFYAMEMVLAVEILHNMGFIHRDLKPDNMLLDKNGHMKLADFGTCIRVNNGKVKTNFQIGTPDYISPEVLRNTGVHDLEVGFEIDWWAFGIVIYELFYGETPFEGESTSTLYQNIMCYKKTLNYPDDKPAKPEFIDFLSRILTEPGDRMGINEIKLHPYLTKSVYPWTFANIREHQSPVIFEVSGEDDTNYITFDPNDKRNNIINSFNNNNYFSGENLAFSGFTFNRFDKYTLNSATHLNSGQSGTGVNYPSSTEFSIKLSEMELAKQQLTIKLEQAVGELAKTQSRLINVEKELVEKESQINSKKSEYGVTAETNKQLKSKIDSITKQSEATQREIEQLKVSISEKDNAIKSLKSDNENLTDEMSNLHSNLITSEQKLGKLNAELDEKNCQIDNLKKLDNLLLEEKSRNQVLQNEINVKSRKIGEYQLQLELMNNNAQKIESQQNSKLKIGEKNNEEFQRLFQEKQNLEIRLNRMTDELNIIDQMKTTAQLELNNEKQKRQDLEKIRDKLSKDVANQKMNVANLQSQLNSAEDQKKVLKQKINVIESEKDQIEQQKKMYESMVQVVRTENEGIIADLEEAEEKNERMLVDFESEKLHFQEKWNSLCKEIESVKEECSEKTIRLKEFDLLKSTKFQLTQQIDQFKLDIEDKKQKIGELSKLSQSQQSELQKNKEQIDSDKAKIMSLVEKLRQILEDPKSKNQISPRKKKEVTNADSSRKIKQLESDLAKEKSKFQEKVQECIEIRNDCQRWRDMFQEQKFELDNKIIEIKDLKANLGNIRKTDSTEDLLKTVDLKSLEGKVEFLKKGKGRHKISWIPSFGILRPFKLEIFQNDSENSLLYSIDLRSMIRIKEPSAAECVHIDKSLLPRIIQIIYEKQETVEDARRQSVISTDMSRRSKSSTMMSEDSNFSSRMSSVELNGIHNIENHSFIPMRFRSFTNCDLCHQAISDLLSPPLALECANCKKRIHFDHIHNNDFKIQWCQGAIDTILFKVESIESKNAWLKQLNCLKEYQKDNEIQVAPNTYYRSIRLPGHQSPNNLSIP